MGMETAALAVSAAGVGMSAVGSYNQAAGQKGALNYESAIADNNSKIAEFQAEQAQAIGAQQEEASRLKTASLFGSQRAALAANGVDLGSGNASEILATTKLMGNNDALTLRDNAARQAWALRVQGQGYQGEAAADAAAAGGISPFSAAAGSLLTGAGQVAGSWYKYNKAVNGTGATVPAYAPGP